MTPDLRHDLRIGQLVRGLDSDKALSQRIGATETLLELQLRFTRPEDQKGLGLPSFDALTSQNVPQLEPSLDCSHVLLMV
jgi:hypothetical protein